MLNGTIFIHVERNNIYDVGCYSMECALLHQPDSFLTNIQSMAEDGHRADRCNNFLSITAAAVKPQQCVFVWMVFDVFGYIQNS